MKKTITIKIKTNDQLKAFQLRAGLGLQAIPDSGTTLLEFDCRRADCGICIVRVLEGGENLSDKTEREADFLKAMHADPDERLACQCRAFGDVTIEVDEF